MPPLPHLLLLATLCLGPTAALAQGNEKGERLFRARCAACHGRDGQGKTKTGLQMGIGDFTTPAWQQAFTDERIRETLLKGVKREKDGKSQEMEALGTEMTEEEIASVIRALRSLRRPAPE